MKKGLFLALFAAAPIAMTAQTALDAYQLSQYDLRGTARYMSMGGAFGALGGDLSSLNQNPGGIGVYRKSEVGITLDIDMQSAKAKTLGNSLTTSQTKAYCNNVGYVGSLNTGSRVMPYFQWGFSYGRTASFDRKYRTADYALNGSLSNYVAGYTRDEAWTPSELDSNPENYLSYKAPWMSMLAFNSYLINDPLNPSTGTDYQGLWRNGTTGIGHADVTEKGYVDEYAINLGGNIMDLVYWGIGFGVTDIQYTQNVYYSENLNGALIPNQRAATPQELDDPAPEWNIVDGQIVNGTTVGAGGFGLNSYKSISGTGFNFKAGVIVRPTNWIRLGLAVHTPTYYNLNQTAWAAIDYNYGYTSGPARADYTGTPDNNVSWKLRTPWRLIASAAGIIGSKAIVSVDYEYRPYQNMIEKDDNGTTYEDLRSDIKQYYKAANILRLGAEYRVSPRFSVRAGYAYESTPTGASVRGNKDMVFTSNPDDSGVTPSYSLDQSTNYITAGIGWNYRGFYADATYVYKHRSTEWHPYSINSYTEDAPSTKVDLSSNNIVLSIGYKF